MTAYTGGSVLLPCYCTDLHTKPEGFIWERDITNRDTWEEISSESGQYRDRFQLVNGHSPGNLSLLISHLTEEDGGVYRCNAKEKGHVFIKLTVKGCILEKGSEMLSITAHTGGSVLLPCYCTDLHTTPETFTWKKFDTNRSTWQEISNESGQYSTRVQLFNGHSPGNLSLLISHLTEKDGGDYSCRVMNNGSKYIRLTVEAASSPSDIDSKFFIYAAVGGSLLLMVLGGVIYWRHRAQRRGQMEGCERKPDLRRDQEIQTDCEVLYATVNKQNKCNKVQETDDVTYSAVVHSNASAPADKLMDTEDTAEYAKLN
ncbi:junctional adhesion molecule-like [Pygocentrus nattereri]|uniref:junctional adhesion molecule-like n=1 Tax=Pygocentrus nattereri TaxID=42514 RepID=UPI0018913B4F|nr:junctional adhesion molecule-like [Pygocentrus nattereri]